jgi:hypothetical protein
MPSIILRPDNFLDPDNQFSRIVQADSGSELLERSIQAYKLQLPSHVEVYVYTSPTGYTNRVRLDQLSSIPGTDPLNGWVYIRVHPTVKSVPTDLLVQ